MIRRIYYWNRYDNFGDQLSPLLIAHFAGIHTKWTYPEMAEIVSTGSVLDVLPQKGWRGAVVGSGRLHEKTQPDLTDAKVLGLRGHLSAAAVTMTYSDRRNLVLGDPALLVDELVAVKRGKYPLGLIAHWSDSERILYKKFAHLDPLEISASEEPTIVLSKIGSCERLISSTLHGIIAADSWGIPRQAEPFPKMSHPWEGGDHKWNDYASVLGVPVRWGEMQTAHSPTVERIKSELFDMLRSLDGTNGL